MASPVPVLLPKATTHSSHNNHGPELKLSLMFKQPHVVFHVVNMILSIVVFASITDQGYVFSVSKSESCVFNGENRPCTFATTNGVLYFLATVIFIFFEYMILRTKHKRLASQQCDEDEYASRSGYEYEYQLDWGFLETLFNAFGTFSYHYQYAVYQVTLAICSIMSIVWFVLFTYLWSKWEREFHAVYTNKNVNAAQTAIVFSLFLSITSLLSVFYIYRKISHFDLRSSYQVVDHFYSPFGGQSQPVASSSGMSYSESYQNGVGDPNRFAFNSQPRVVPQATNQITTTSSSKTMQKKPASLA
eukprot:Nk52_evm80s554 gene=Nk52_evmTU80s554